MRRQSLVRGVLPLACMIMLAGEVHGQTGAESAASAEVLFREAKQMMEDGNHALACPKLEASQRLDPAVGTILNLAICHEQINKTASAWAEYVRAASMARRKGQVEREKFASERATILEQRLTRLAFAVDEEALVEGLVVRRDGIVQESATWATATPVDPGSHVISVTAPGKVEWRTTIDVSGEGKTVTIDVPALQAAPVEPQAPDVTAPEPVRPKPVALNTSTGSTDQRTIGILAGGVGLAGLAVGSIFGLAARTKWEDADCPANVCPTREQQDRAEDAKRFASISTWSFAGGGALAIAGAVLFLTAGNDPPTREVAGGWPMELRVLPAAGDNAAGVFFDGHF